MGESGGAVSRSTQDEQLLIHIPATAAEIFAAREYAQSDWRQETTCVLMQAKNWAACNG